MCFACDPKCPHCIYYDEESYDDSPPTPAVRLCDECYNEFSLEEKREVSYGQLAEPANYIFDDDLDCLRIAKPGEWNRTRKAIYNYEIWKRADHTNLAPLEKLY